MMSNKRLFKKMIHSELIMAFYSEYFDIQFQSEQQYKDVIVLIEKGSFYEAYGTDIKGKVKQVGKILNMIVTLANKNIPMSDTNPYMIGFPTASSEKNIPVLVSKGMTVVLMHQVWDNFNRKVKERKIARVITPGTYIECPPSDLNYNICCVHCNGPIHNITVIDLSIGKIEVLTLVGTEELEWFVQYYNPVEIIVLSKENEEHLKKMLTNRTIYEKTIGSKETKMYFDKVCQYEILKKVNMECNESDDIERCFTVSLVCLIDYVYSIHPTSLIDLRFPKVNEFDNRLILYNNAVKQLDVVSSEKNKGLFNIVNRTNTAMGKRLLRNQLLTPIMNICDLNEMYDSIATYMSKPDTIHEIQNVLIGIPDIDRLLKKIGMGQNTIIDIQTLYGVCDHVKTIETHLKSPIQATEIMEHISSHFEIDSPQWNVRPNVSSEIDNSVFELEKVKKRIEEVPSEYENEDIKTQLECFKLLNIDEAKSTLKMKNLQQIYGMKPAWKSHFHLKNDKSGTYIACSAKGLKFLKATGLDKEWSVDSNTKTNIKLSTKMTTDILAKYDHLKENAETVYKEYVTKYSTELHAKFSENIREISEAIAQLDCTISKASVALERKYVRPEFAALTEHSTIHTTGIRHPIVEAFIDDVYIGNDINLDKGVLLYGINGSGKSTFGKSIALNIILAQAGFFVSATTFRYTPFTKLFVRINCDDDIYNGLSSFQVEMNELRTISRLADSQSLIVGDELCKGTEEISANAIVAGVVKWLSDRHISFVLATHLHNILTIDYVNELIATNRLQIKHVSTGFDPKKEKLIFNRTIQDGNGDSLYGIHVAKCLLRCPEIHNLTMQASNQIQGNKAHIVNNKKSKYNKNVLLDECEKCGEFKDLHTHHIIEQKHFEKGNKNKNVKTNLQVLCKTCHERHHYN